MEPVSHVNTNLRRAPVQQRSAERLARILDACAELLDETGYEQLSTRAVAARAEVPIGSVYRFFSNKRALTDALARRNLDSFAERVTGRLTAIPTTDWRSAIDAVLDEYLAMKRSMASPWSTSALAPVDDPADDANRRVATRRTALRVLRPGPRGGAAPRRPGLRRDRRRRPQARVPQRPGGRPGHHHRDPPPAAGLPGAAPGLTRMSGAGPHPAREHRVDLVFCSYCSRVNVLLTL